MAAYIKEGDAAPLKILVMKVKEIVMDLVMVENMMVMLVVKEILSVAAIIANSLVPTTMKKMIAVKNKAKVNFVLYKKRTKKYVYFPL